MSARCQALFVVLAVALSAAVGWQENGRRGVAPSRPATSTVEVNVSEKVPKRGKASKPPGSVNSDGAPGGADATDERLQGAKRQTAEHIKARRGDIRPALVVRPREQGAISESEPGLRGLSHATRREMYIAAVRALGLDVSDRLALLGTDLWIADPNLDDEAYTAMVRVVIAVSSAYMANNLDALRCMERAALASLPQLDPFVLERNKAARSIHEMIVHQIREKRDPAMVAWQITASLIDDDAAVIARDIPDINDPSWLRSALDPDAPLTKAVRKVLDNADPGRSPEDLAETVLRAALRALGYPENKARTLTPSLDGTT